MANSDKVSQIYQDDEISVFWRPGNETDDLLCSFSDLISLVKGKRFFADVPTEKLGWPCLGFVAAKPNWYPKANMQKAITAAQHMLDRYKRHTCYGGSMGGYAAIKYSRMIRATTTVALCPQWTLDQSRNPSFNIGWQKYFSPEMVGMDIESSDISGKVFIFLDKTFRIDSWHAEQISRVHSEAHLINMPGIEHHVTPALAGTQRLRKIVAAARASDLARLRQTAAESRKTSMFRINHVIARGCERYMSRGSPNVGSNRNFSSVQDVTKMAVSVYLPRYLVRHDRIADALSTIQRSAPKGSQLGYFATALASATAETGHRIAVKTSHGLILSGCPATGGIRQSTTQDVACPLDIEIDGARARLILIAQGLRLAMTPWLDLINHPKGAFSLRSETGFLSAQPNGALESNRQDHSQWETFSLTIINDASVGKLPFTVPSRAPALPNGR